MRWVIVILSVVALMLVRAFENEWFYDPFIRHFKGENYFYTVPDYQMVTLLLSTLARYTLNTILSVVVLYFIFKSASQVRFWIFFYFSSAVVLMALFLLLLSFLPAYYEVFFYVRRFLIQPLFLLILLPAAYLESLHKQKTNSKK